MPRLAANLSLMFGEVEFLDRFAAAAAAGFRAVEFLSPYEHPAALVRRRLDDAGVEPVLFNLPPGEWDQGERGLAAVPGREAAFRDGLELALDYAGALRCPRLHAMAGIVPGGISPLRCADTYLDNLVHAAGRCAAHGITILIEPLNPIDMPGYFLGSTETARRFIDAVGHASLKLQFDAYHVQMSEGALTRRFLKHRPVIGHIQVAGVPGRHEPDDEQEINYPYLFGLIEQSGYDGWIGCEYRPRQTTAAGLGWAATYGIGARQKADVE